MDTKFLIAQLPFLFVVILLVVKLLLGYKRGLVKELCGIVATIFAAAIVLLIAFAMRQYFNEDRLVFVTTLVLLFLLIVLYKVVNTFLTGLKIFSKVPGLNLVDKILGPVLGFVETILIVWTVFCLVIIMDMGAFENLMMLSVRNNIVMKYLYMYNYMFGIVQQFSVNLKDLRLMDKIEELVR
ncbi:MAG: CvpA family protein [Lachnospiraceae bacterium]|nr:CvpA family protein [Lachnospiraceae bacterium]